MKKTIFILIVYLLFFNFAFSEEVKKKECDEFKKLSKEYLACKTKKIKKGFKEFSFTEDIKINKKSLSEIFKK